jgi:hypothetical protein
MATKVGSIFVHSLKTTSVYCAGMVVECYSDSGLTALVGFQVSHAVWDGTYWQQKTLIPFHGLVVGNTYYMRAGVVCPVSGNITWSSVYSTSASAGTAPAPTYTFAYDSIANGTSYTVTVSSEPTDINHYEVYYNFTNTAPSSSTMPQFRLTGNPFHFTISASHSSTVYPWVRAVTTSVNIQAWTALTAKTPAVFGGTMDDVPDGTTYAKVSATAISSGQIASLQSKPVSATPPTAGQSLVYNGTAWAPAAGGGGGGGIAQAGQRQAWYMVDNVLFPDLGINAMGDQIVRTGTIWSTCTAGTATNAKAMERREASTPDSLAGMYGELQWFVGSALQEITSCYLTQTTDCRMWVGFTTSTGAVTMGGSDTPTGQYACFRFSSVAGDTTYQCVTSDGSSHTVVNSGVTGDTNTHRFGISFNDTTPSVSFYIDGSLVATITTHLPSSGTAMALLVGVAYHTSAGVRIGLSHAMVQTNN